MFQGLETVDNSYFITEDNVGMLKLAKEAGTILVRAFTSPAVRCRIQISSELTISFPCSSTTASR